MGGGEWCDGPGVEKRQNGMRNEFFKEKNYFPRSTSVKLSSEVKGGDLKFIICVRGSCCYYSQRVPNNSATPLDIRAQQGLLNLFFSESIHSQRYFILTVTLFFVYLSDYEGTWLFLTTQLRSQTFLCVVDRIYDRTGSRVADPGDCTA